MNVKRCAKSIRHGYHPAQGGWHQQCSRDAGKGSAYCWQHKKKEKKR